MDYRILLQEENDAVRERYQLSMERIRSMETEEMRLPYGSYFKKTAAFIDHREAGGGQDAGGPGQYEPGAASG